MIGSAFLRRLRSWSARRFLSRVHRVTHRMQVELRTVARSRVLIVAPHMDDAEIGCGGTLVLHGRAGSELGILYTTDSGNTDGQKLSAEELRRLRRSEAERSAKRLGVEILAVADFPDGALSRHETALADLIADWLRRWKPEQLFCPFPADNHRDHQATTAAVALALERSGWRGEVWCFEVWTALWPNVAIDISKVQAEKAEAIACYASQTAAMPYAEAALGLNRFRGLRVGVESAEAFHVGTADAFRELCAPLFRL
jgi:LmbE family N-acetylglucosaminyl deacetylase